MINSREIIFNSVRNIGFKDGKPADEKLILNHSVRKGENGDLLILIGANNSGKSNILDGIQWSKYIKGISIENNQRRIGNYQRKIEYYQWRIEYYQRGIENCQREIGNYQREIENYQGIENYQRGIENGQRGIENCQREIENCQREIENCQREIEIYREVTTNLYPDEVCRKPNVSFHVTNANLNEIKLADIKKENIRQLIEDEVFPKLLKEKFLGLYETWYGYISRERVNFYFEAGMCSLEMRNPSPRERYFSHLFLSEYLTTPISDEDFINNNPYSEESDCGNTNEDISDLKISVCDTKRNEIIMEC